MTAYEVTAVLSAHAHLVDAQPAEGEAAHEAGEDAHGEGVGRREHRARLLGREPRELEEPRGHTLRLRLLLRIRRAGATRRALGRHARHCRLPFAHGRGRHPPARRLRRPPARRLRRRLRLRLSSPRVHRRSRVAAEAARARREVLLVRGAPLQPRPARAPIVAVGGAAALQPVPQPALQPALQPVDGAQPPGHLLRRLVPLRRPERAQQHAPQLSPLRVCVEACRRRGAIT